ncbi:NrdC glutaredoxin [Synechococcus phage metaG-MbCM1]|uniref:NrdC glutaredoxin n=1 Tax=Synechococcus phage metaG-MbCM1 TaxID=1079999 RepID=H8ZNK4_9CAUD|nr:NrdC glutaredoxin [Synechococcus phage metaG-MbCM1]AFD03065.1 NrdC glutaredoxin [Synechococcus phage metaG-MbCM1]
MFMNFAVYTRTGCPYCTKIKQVLEGKGYNFREYRLGVDFERDAFYNQFGNGSTFPQVVLNSTNLGGCTETVQYLRENNLM